MYTFEDIRDIAIQIERNGERTYRKASEITKDPELAKILLWLADEEHRHKKWFNALQTERKLSPEHREMEAMGRALLQDMVKDQPFSLDAEQLDGAKTDAHRASPCVTDDAHRSSHSSLVPSSRSTLLRERHRCAQSIFVSSFTTVCRTSGASSSHEGWTAGTRNSSN